MAKVQRIRGGAIRPSIRSFLDDAERWLEVSRHAERGDEALSASYRAALRAAGALIEWRMQDRKRRPSGSAWSKLKTLDPSLGPMCQRFEVHARLDSRASMGLEKNVNPLVVEKLYDQACDLVDFVRDEVNYLPEVA